MTASRGLVADEVQLVESIRQHGAISRTDLSRMTGFSRAKVTPLVTRLLEIGVLEEVGDGESQGGRRPRLLNFSHQRGYVVGVDIGATSIDVALADLTGRMLERISEVADVRAGPNQVLGHVSDIILTLLAQRGAANDQIYAIGVGVPGPVQFATGLLIAPPLMPGWHTFPIRATLRQRFSQANVVVDNDVNIMALAEHRVGAGVGIEHLIFVKIGTGIGGGIICNNAIYRGSFGCAGDIGHICADPNGPVCHCGNVGCLEALAAGPSIAGQAVAAANAGNSSILAERLAAHGRLTSEDVGAAAAAGDRAALEIIQRSGQLVGDVLAALVNFYNPSLLLIGGGVSLIGYQLLASIRQRVLQRSLPLATKDLRIEYASLGLDAGINGAVTLALEHAFGLHTSVKA